MSKQVLFNGAVLVRPGAATAIDASQFQNVTLSGLGTVALIGEADDGEPRTVQTFGSAKKVKDFYRSGNLVEAAQMVAAPGNDPRIPTGAQSIITYKVNNSTQATLVNDTVMTFTSKRYGLAANNARVEITSSGSDLRVVTLSEIDDFGNVVTETSPEFGSLVDYGKWTIRYVGGDGGAVTMDVTITGMTTTTSATPADDLVLLWADYPDLASLVRHIDGLAAYDAVELITNGPSFLNINLDGITAVDIKAGVTTIMAHNFDLSDWVNQNSSIATCAISPLASTGPRTVLTEVALAGGTVGTSANSDWVTGFTALAGIRANQVVPLAAADPPAAIGTYTIAAVLTGLDAHTKLLSSTAGRSERQGWGAMDDTKDNIIAQANILNSEHTILTGQKATRQSATSGDLTEFPGWSVACILAGMRAGAPLGEPLTHKFASMTALSQDAGWQNNDDDDVADMILNGVMTIATIPGQGFRIEKGITTFTKSDNDSFTEETLVQGWKNIAFEWRTALEARYTGRPGVPGIVNTVIPFSTVVLQKLRDAGAIADSVVEGVVTSGFKDLFVELNGDVLEVGGTVSPTPGINFILNTIVLVPASISF